MKQELEQQIINKAPYMFRYSGWDNLQESLISFGFDCGQGWYWLLKKLVEDIAEIDLNKAVRVSQIKEKYGTLRFNFNYIFPDHDYDVDHIIYDKINDLVMKAEIDSETICEVCGEVGSVKGQYWLKCTCLRCELEKDNAERIKYDE